MMRCGFLATEVDMNPVDIEISFSLQLGIALGACPSVKGHSQAVTGKSCRNVLPSKGLS
jgi:hypothetical protein